MKNKKKNSDIYNFISKKKLKKCVESFVKGYQKAYINQREKFFSNKIDPMLAIFSIFLNDINYDKWIKSENARQLNKTLENLNGSFQQDLLRSMNGWKKMEILDAVNDTKKLIVDVKNKYNTEKGSKKVKQYDEISSCLKKTKYLGFTGYYLTIIKNKKGSLDRPFVPSDNTTRQRRPSREDIREIDGVTFYKKITGDKHFFFKIYQEIPKVLSEILNKKDFGKVLIKDKRFKNYFKLTFN